MAQPKLLIQPWGENGLRNAIPHNRTDGMAQENATYADGFPIVTMTPISLGGKPPSGKDMNGVLHEITSHIVYQNNGQRYRFDTVYCQAIGGYPKGAVLMNDVGDTEYISLVDKNTTNFNVATVNIAGKWAVLSNAAQLANKVNKTDKASTSVAGVVQLNNTLTSTSQTEALTAAQGKVLAEQIAAAVSGSFNLRGQLTTQNLNDLHNTENYGVWQCALNASATTERNYPIARTGTLLVLPSAYRGQQVYISFDNKGIWLRDTLNFATTPTWSEWFRLGSDKLGNAGNQTLSGSLNINNTGWEKINFPTTGGRWRMEFDPQGAANKRMNFNFVSDDRSEVYIWFPTLTKNENVAYQSWVNEQLTDAVPSGTVAYFLGTHAPAGWLKANGAAISRTTYAKLFAVVGTSYGGGDGRTTFNIPDLRGEFIRSWDDGRGVDSNRVIGVWQSDAIRNIVGRLPVFDDLSANHGVVTDGAFYHTREKVQLPGGNMLENGVRPHFDASRVVPTADENRPRNVALLACIKI